MIFPDICGVRALYEEIGWVGAQPFYLGGGGIKINFGSHSNIYVKICPSRLCIKMSSFLFMRTWEITRTLYVSCGIPFLVLTSDKTRHGLQSQTPVKARS